MQEQLIAFAREASRFGFGPHQTDSCTSCADLVVEHFGGQVRGYFTRTMRWLGSARLKAAMISR